MENSPYRPGGIPVYQVIGKALTVEEMGKGEIAVGVSSEREYGVDALRMIVSLIEISERRLR